MSGPAVVECGAVTHHYVDDEGTSVTALDDVDLQVSPGEAVALVGPSGSGKSTLLTVLAGLVRPTSGRVVVAGTDVTRAGEPSLLRLRSAAVGVVLQTPGRNLLPYASGRENVAFAARARTSGRNARAGQRQEADELLEAVGVLAVADRPARFLSGGQQQRLALAVALVGGPAVVLADEPTSQLDRATGDAVVELMLALRERHGSALVLVTHDARVSERLDRTCRITDGRLRPGTPASAVTS